MHFFDWWQFYRCKRFKTDFYDFSGTLWWKNFFWKTLPHFFPDREQFIFWLSAKFLQRGCPNCLYVFRRHFQDADFSIVLFSVQIQILSSFFLTFGTIFSVKLSKLLSPCSDKHFDGNHFFGKFFKLSSDFERNIFWTWVKISQESSQNVSCVFRKIFRKLTFRRIFWSLYIVGLWVEVFLNFGSFFAN